MKTYRFTGNVTFSHFLNNLEFEVKIIPDLPVGFSFAKDKLLYLQNDAQLQELIAHGMIEEVKKKPREIWLAPFQVIEDGKQVMRYKEVSKDSKFVGKLKAIEVFE